MNLILFFIFYNILSLVNLGVLINLLYANDTHYALKILSLLGLILILFVKTLIVQLKQANIFLYILDFKLPEKRDLQFIGEFYFNVVKMAYIILYHILLYSASPFQYQYALGLVLSKMYLAIISGKNFKDIILYGIQLPLGLALFRQLYLSVDLLEFLSFHLFQYTLIEIIQAYRQKSSKFAINSSSLSKYYITYLIGQQAPLTNDRKTMCNSNWTKDREIQEFLVLDHIFLGVYFFNQLHMAVKLALFLCLPVIIIKLYNLIRVLQQGPLFMNMQVDSGNKINLIRKLKQQQYFVKFTFCDLPFEEIKTFMEEFLELNPNIYYEFDIYDQQYLKFKKPTSCDNFQYDCYTINSLNLQSLKFQLDIFFLSKVLKYEQMLFINYPKLYFKFGQFTIDNIMLEFDYFKQVPNIAGKKSSSSKFIHHYYQFKKTVLVQSVCFQKILSQFILINPNYLFYDLFDNFV